MLQSIATCWPFLCLNKLVTSSRNVRRTCRNACREGSLHLVRGKTWWSIQDNFKHSKTSSRCLHFDVRNAWQMGHTSPEGISFEQELLLDFAAWLDLTLNADNTITVHQLPLKFQNTYWFFKTCWWLMGLSRPYDGSQPPGRHTRYFKTMLKILVDIALMRHILFLFDVFRLMLDRLTNVNNLFPDFRSI